MVANGSIPRMSIKQVKPIDDQKNQYDDRSENQKLRPSQKGICQYFRHLIILF